MTIECHELTTTNGRVEMAYAGAKPWHGLGTLIPANANADEMRVAAGMDWTIQRAPVNFVHTSWDDGAVNMKDAGVGTLNDRHVLYRSDTKAALAVVSDRFHVVQPCEAIDFFRDMVEAGGFEMETAGTMQGGKRMWCMVKTGRGFVMGGDTVESRLLLATANDGTLSTSVRETAIRVVCRNTFNIALNRGRSVSVRHTSRFDPEAVKKQLVNVSDAFKQFQFAAQAMARAKASASFAEAFLERLLPEPRFGLVEDTRGYKKILALFNGEAKGAELPSSAGTMWGMFNAVTEFTDHHSRSRNEETRADSALFGGGDTLKAKAFELLASASE